MCKLYRATVQEDKEGNLFIDTSGHYSRPDVFHLTVDTRSKQNVQFED